MNVFTDFHHSALMRSLVLLFEKRLGGRIYRPIGEEWHTEGFWHVYDHPATVQQYLTLAQGHKPSDGTPPLNRFWHEPGDDPEVYLCADPENESFNRAITLEKFKKMPIDIVIASIPAHIEPFKRLIREYKPNAKLILQVGNNWLWEEMGVENVMASTFPKAYPASKNVIFYHQEFDLETFHFSTTPGDKVINSFVNILSSYGEQDFLQLEELLPEYRFGSYGAGNRDGNKHGVKEVAAGMQQADWIYHVKRGGDGFGHIIHNAFASGRPVITRKSHYKDCLAGELMEHMVTCIDLDQCENNWEAAELIRHSDAIQMAKNAYKKFCQVVDYDAEEKKIREFLGRLI